MGFLGVIRSRRGREGEVLGRVSVLIRGRDTRAQICGCARSLSLTHILWSWDHTVRGKPSVSLEEGPHQGPNLWPP